MESWIEYSKCVIAVMGRGSPGRWLGYVDIEGVEVADIVGFLEKGEQGRIGRQARISGLCETSVTRSFDFLARRTKA